MKKLTQAEYLPIEKLKPFEGHPFYVKDDDDMNQLTESIRSQGVLTPLVVRPLPNDEYEVISGHRRLHACKKAFAYKMKLETLNHQGISGQPGQKWTRDSLAEGANDSSRQIHRYIRLTTLIPGILQKVDSGEIALTPAVELSYFG